jgi:LacI family transcriptional regulator
VFIDETVPDVGVGQVTLENREGVGALVEHLAGHGYTRIGFLSGPEDRTASRERLEGYHAAMAAHSLEALPGLVRECEWSLRSGIEQMLALLDSGLSPDAVAASSAELALGALAACRSRGLRLPGDLAIAAFDDSYFAPLLEPALTAISYDTLDMGARSAKLLVNAIESENPAYEEIRIGVELVRRRSCGCDFDFMLELGGPDPIR